jgi:hypothetical protein
MTRELIPSTLPLIRARRVNMTRGLCTSPPFSARVSTVALLAALALAVLPGLFVSGCSNPSSPGDKHQPPPFTLPRTSPENVLYNFRSIYAGADASVKTEADTLQWGEMYQSLFHPDTFAFYFVPGDQPPGWPNAWWGLLDEVGSFRALLRHKAWGTIDDIQLSWTVNASEPDSRTGIGDPPPLLHPTWRRVYVTAILLDVVAGVNIYRVSNGTADFYFAPDPADSTLWVITEWYDHQPVGGAPPSRASLTRATSTTWGAIKGLFY